MNNKMLINISEKLIELTATQGIWTLISVSLTFYILKNQKKRDIKQEEREKNYQLIISNLSDKLNVVEDIQEDIKEIKNNLKK
ncbi:BhlA/UviB family holin-like peptide [Sedimentibacter sp. zth1]|uniref:BhlA/UviB family holin-like peptide n=1 Tax=Sedimentibacter sp. zth1 TaxID=2816908 RepID=UPI0035301C60